MSAPEVVAVLAGGWIVLKWLFLKDRSAEGHWMFLMVKTVPFVIYIGVLEIFLVMVPFGSLLFWLFLIPVWICARKVKKLTRREISRQLYRRDKLKAPEQAEVVPNRKLVVMIWEMGQFTMFQVLEAGDLFSRRSPFPDWVELRLQTVALGEHTIIVQKWPFKRRGRFKITNHNGASKVQRVET